MNLEETKRYTIWIIRYITVVIIVTSILIFFINKSEYNRDDTDGENRSNMRLHTDAKTGCQYLSSKHGGLIQRTNNYGRHLGCKVIE